MSEKSALLISQAAENPCRAVAEFQPLLKEEGDHPTWIHAQDRCRNLRYFMQFCEAESGSRISSVLEVQFAIVFIAFTRSDALAKDLQLLI